MGWKNVKAYYRIEHIVHADSRGICIGSPYLSDLIVIGRDGRVLKRYDRTANDDLSRCQAEMDADPAALARLVSEADTFEVALPVFTFAGGTIVEKRCEAYGWPNVTHDGQIMYKNTHSHDRSQVIEWAREDVACALRVAERDVSDAEMQLANARKRLLVAAKQREDFSREFPANKEGVK